MNHYILSIPFNTIRLTIDDFNEYTISGTAYNNTIQHPIHFHDISEFILKMDNIFDKNGNPLASKIKRSFKNENYQFPYQNVPKMYCSYEKLQQYKGKLIEFDIVVISRNNNSWQGIMIYQNQEYVFDAIFILIKNIEKILTNQSINSF